MKNWELIEKVLSVSRRIYIWGPPGTGKTTVAVKNVNNGKKVYQVTLTPETTMTEIRGHFILRGNEYVWHDGVGIRAWREGARLVLNEITEASGDVLTFCLALLDDPDIAYLTLPTGESVSPASEFQVVATANLPPSNLPPALKDRFPVSIFIDEVHPDALAKLSPELRDVCRAGVKLEEERKTSIRCWLEFQKLREQLGVELAAMAVFGDRSEDVITAIKLTEKK